MMYIVYRLFVSFYHLLRSYGKYVLVLQNLNFSRHKMVSLFSLYRTGAGLPGESRADARLPLCSNLGMEWNKARTHQCSVYTWSVIRVVHGSGGTTCGHPNGPPRINL